MKKRTLFRIMILLCFATSLLIFVSGALAAVTENECTNGGGSIAQGAGCKFCVGGKYDLSEIKEPGKSNAPQSDSEQKSGGKTSGESVTKPSDKK